MYGARWSGKRLVPVVPTEGFTVNNGPLFHLMHYPILNVYPNFQAALPEDAPNGVLNPAQGTRMWFVFNGVTYTGYIDLCAVMTVYRHDNSTRWYTRYVRVVFADHTTGWYDLWQMLTNNTTGIHANQNTPLTNGPPPPPPPTA